MHKHSTEHLTNLKNLWHTVFGDAPSVIDTYFNIFYSPDLTATEFVDGELAAAAYVMPAGELVYGETQEKCAHIYAVAVYPKFRGRGLGIAVTNRAVELAKKAGFSAVVLHPAEDSLFGYYEKHCGFTTCFSADEKVFCENITLYSPADITTYMAVRESLLSDIPHVALNRDILDFFTKCGGELYVQDGGCAAVETYDGITYIREALGFGTPTGNTPTGMIHGCAPFESGWMGLTLE